MIGSSSHTACVFKPPISWTIGLGISSIMPVAVAIEHEAPIVSTV